MHKHICEALVLTASVHTMQILYTRSMARPAVYHFETTLKALNKKAHKNITLHITNIQQLLLHAQTNKPNEILDTYCTAVRQLYERKKEVSKWVCLWSSHDPRGQWKGRSAAEYFLFVCLFVSYSNSGPTVIVFF